MVKLLVMDVDGTLTDGKIYMGENGELFKAFDVKDGYAIYHLLSINNITPIIITAKNTGIVQKRAEALGINEIYQGVKDKLQVLNDILEKYNYTFEDVAYIGDDIPDLECMKKSRIVGCPSDAVREVLDVADFVSNKKGGEGAVREFIEWLIK